MGGNPSDALQMFHDELSLRADLGPFLEPDGWPGGGPPIVGASGSPPGGGK